MPNYCENRIEIYGATLDFKNVLEDNKENIFELIMPTPEVLKNYSEANKTVEEIAADKARFISTYGYDNAYDFRVNEWGCKWDADVWSIDYHINSNYISFSFNTPWSPPSDKLLQSLAYYIVDNNYMAHPLEIKNYYYEPGMVFSGISTVEYDGVDMFCDEESFDLPDIDCYSTESYRDQAINQGYPESLYLLYFDEDWTLESCQNDLFGEED